jgi:hypothetical protein
MLLFKERLAHVFIGLDANLTPENGQKRPQTTYKLVRSFQISRDGAMQSDLIRWLTCFNQVAN